MEMELLTEIIKWYGVAFSIATIYVKATKTKEDDKWVEKGHGFIMKWSRFLCKLATFSKREAPK